MRIYKFKKKTLYIKKCENKSFLFPQSKTLSIYHTNLESRNFKYETKNMGNVHENCKNFENYTIKSNIRMRGI